MRLKTVLLITFLTLALVLAACQNVGSTTTESAPDAAPDVAQDAAPDVAPTEAPAEEETVEETDNAETNDSESTSSEDEQTEGSDAEESNSEESGAEAAADVGELTIFQIVQEQSEARFHIDEILRGEDVTVVGKTSMVTGEITINPANLAQTEIGPIQVDARDLATDSRRRNTAIRRFILGSASDANRFITFTPTAIDGLPDSASAGDTVEFQVTGDLQIRDTTNSVTFDMSVTANSNSEISGLGSTTILYSDFGLFIPSVPFVASVEDEVILELEFTAAAAE